MKRLSLRQEKLDHQPTNRNSYMSPREKNARATLLPCRDTQTRYLSNGPPGDDKDEDLRKNKLCIVGRLSSADEQTRTTVCVEIINKSTVGTLRPVASRRMTNNPEVLRGAGGTRQRPPRNATSMHGELLARTNNNVVHRRHGQDGNRKLENCRSLTDRSSNTGCGSNLSVGGVGLSNLSSVADVITISEFMNCSVSDGADSRLQPLNQSALDVSVNGVICTSDACASYCPAGIQSDDTVGGTEKEFQNCERVGSSSGKMKEASSAVVTKETVDLLRKDLNSASKMREISCVIVNNETIELLRKDLNSTGKIKETSCVTNETVDLRNDLDSAGKVKEASSGVTNETVNLLRKDFNSLDAQQCDTSPSLRVKSLRKPTGTRKRSDGSKSASPSPGASPVLPHFSTSGSGTDDTASIGDDGSGDDDEEDDGVYDETFRYSSYKYVADDDVTDFESASDDQTLESESIDKHQDMRFGSSVSESTLYNCSVKKNHHRSFSMTTPEVKRNGDVASRLLSRKVIKRHASMGAETYQTQSDKVYTVERTLILQKPDSVESFGFHILGQNPMVISTVEPGSAAEFGGVQVGDRLVTINGTNVIKAKESTVIDLVLQSPRQLELGVASGSLSRDICICSSYLNLKPEGIMKKWKKRWCQLKYDGFLYYYNTEQDINPLGAISLSNYIIIRGTDCSRTCMFKLVKYGQKTYYLQTESEEDMNRWASHINMATTMSKNLLCDTWLDISSHNVRLPALSIKKPDCHGFLTKIGYRKKNWRKRYCVLKSACLYYYKDQTSSTAKGVVHLHGYTIEEESLYHRRFGFMAVPPVPQMRTFHFTAENETDMQRWITVLRSSIGKWVKVEE